MRRLMIFLTLAFGVLAIAGCSLMTTAGTAATSTTTDASSSTVSTSTTSSTQASTTNPTTAATTGSTTTTAPLPRFQTIELYSMNDVHGGSYYSDLSTLAKAAGLLQYKTATTDDAIVIATGDMFQGTALSNYYYGLPLVETMNYAGFTAFTLGNHEFDWGIDKIANYADGNPDNGEADFTFLAANIVSKTDGQPMPWTRPYVIVDVNGVRVGIIGVIGDVIDSISVDRVAGYEFTDAADAVANYARILRTEEDCDVVVASIHEYTSTTNNAIANLTGDAKVDAIFNGHTHTSVASTISRSGVALPFAQVSSYDSSVIAKITLVYDRTLGRVTQGAAEVISATGLTPSTYVTNLLDLFAEDPEYVAFTTQVLATAAGYYGRWNLAPWGASVVRDYVGLDFGMVNGGGFRVDMESGQVTMGELIAIYPFDNYIKTCELTGLQLTRFYEDVRDSGWDVVFDDAVSYSGGVLYKDGVAVSLTGKYTVGAVDYIFDKSHYAFVDGTNIQTTVFLMRNLLALDLENHAGLFDPAGGTAYQTPVLWLPERRDELTA